MNNESIGYEDEKSLSESICAYLANEQFVTEAVFDVASAMEKIDLFEYACIILDIGLPDGNGLQILKALKEDKKAEGVLIISAKASLDDRLIGLNEGADDYVVKPFHLSELLARVAAIIRRKSFGGQNLIVFDLLQIDLNKRIVSISGKETELTKKEYELLLYFLGNKNRVISKNALATHLWGDHMDMAGNYDFIYTHIKDRRKKLMQAGAPDYFKAVYGVDYKFHLAKE